MSCASSNNVGTIISKPIVLPQGSARNPWLAVSSASCARCQRARSREFPRRASAVMAARVQIMRS